MEWRHDVEAKDLEKASDAVVQESEIEMEGHIRGAEVKAMQERRMLNSLLDSVVDSVISIDPRGTITRF
jgi:signal transduction histidine kinase